jgi:hypothetical protein
MLKKIFTGWKTKWVSRPVVTMLTEPPCLLVSIIILWYFHKQIQLNAPYLAMFFSYMQNASCNAILKAFFKINQ